MSFVVARTGRLRQRYEDNFRLVSGCIPYRWRKDMNDPKGHTEYIIEVLMVTSPKRDDLVFPKGGWEDDETVIEAACREALEEAGVKGIPRENPLGMWEFRSKSNQDLCSLEGGCRGYMFALEVTEELETWPEQKNRARQWLNVRDAFRLCRYDWMCEALEEFVKVMAEESRELQKKKEEEVDVPLITQVSDVSTNMFIRPSTTTTTTQHHSMLLEEFVKVMAEESRELQKKKEEELDVPLITQVPDVSTNMFIRPSTTTTTTQHHSMSSLKHPPLAAAKDIIAVHFGC